VKTVKPAEPVTRADDPIAPIAARVTFCRPENDVYDQT
jgi:hypothetical protein